jgi:hypothetical protein
MKKYFYVIMRSGQIYEVPYTEQKLAMFVAAMRDKGIAMPKDLGAVINGVDIAQVLDETGYKQYIDSAQPKMYIKNGTWYDVKERKAVRHEPWKQKEVDEQLRLESEEKEYVPTEEEKKRIDAIKADINKMVNRLK